MNRIYELQKNIETARHELDEALLQENRFEYYLGFFLLQFGTRWGNIIIQVEESGGEWYKVVDKFITLWKTTEGRCLCYVHGRIQSHSGPKGQTDRSIQIQRAVRQ